MRNLNNTDFIVQTFISKL